MPRLIGRPGRTQAAGLPSRELRSGPWPFLDPACEQARDLGDPCRAQVRPPLRSVDVTQVAIAVELRERVEERAGRGVGIQRGGNVLGKITALRTLRRQFHR